MSDAVASGISDLDQLEALLCGANEHYFSELLARYRSKPQSVGNEWHPLLELLCDETDDVPSYDGPKWQPRDRKIIGQATSRKQSLSDAIVEAGKSKDPLKAFLEQLQEGIQKHDDVQSGRGALLDSIQALMLIRAYRVIGHFKARLDPLGLARQNEMAELDPANYGFGENDLDRPIFINYYLGLETATLREIIAICESAYCGSIGAEFLHIQNMEEKRWLQEHLEVDLMLRRLTGTRKREILESITQADLFESFLDVKYRGAKRFGLDGGETLVPMIEQMLNRGGDLGLEEVVIGMAHRGRLNVLANIMQKPYRAIFAEFQGHMANQDAGFGSGDVKYHLGASSNRTFNDHTVHLSLTPNPSHLEAVNTVVLGKVRAKQRQRRDLNKTKVMGLLLHGDAAFIGQGIVAETFLLSQLEGYTTGGTVHIAINNQIGFTTDPAAGRSSPYCSDMAKTIDAPVLHVNGDDPEACIHATQLAIEYRQRFGKDVVIDLWCYRRHGHNESDEPMFTQPKMYKTIASHPTTREIYAKKLIDENVITTSDFENCNSQIKKTLEVEYASASTYNGSGGDWLEGQWSGISVANGGARRGNTGVSEAFLKEVGSALTKLPQNFHTHRKLSKLYDDRKQAIEKGVGIDWAMAEALAFGTLLCESNSIRLSGEDVGRGTFSHRHAVLHDQDNERIYIPFNHIRADQAPFRVIDSPLSEFGLLGFEYGYASAEPHALVVWEAQFGDFANGAQVVIDQFIASGETKWLRMCGLVMLLPHGYEGQGPEHSSARMERYLQLCAEDNMQVCNLTTPANYFHALRRQLRRDFRKPLIVMSPKSLLRHKQCVSRLHEMGPETSFHRILWDDRQLVEKALVADHKIRRVVICSGKIYYDLLEAALKNNIRDVYLMRLEQIYPFDYALVKDELSRFTNSEVVWCQEEPENAGAWHFLDRRLEAILLELGLKNAKRPRYVGRAEAASPAVGSLRLHQEQQQAVIAEALK